jgi:hypothetical protein
MSCSGACLANFGLQRTRTSLRSALAAEAVIRWAGELMGLDAIIVSCAALILTGLVYSFRHVLLGKPPPIPKISTANAEARCCS